MAYLVVVTFDLTDAPTSTYEQIIHDLGEYGLHSHLVGDSDKKTNLPDNTYAGKFSGENAGKIRDDVSSKVQGILSQNEAVGKIFVSVGGSWAWGIRHTT